jgi:hypothetical protein
MKVEGLHLWEIKVSYTEASGAAFHVNLWITTTRQSLPLAIQKAKTFLKREREAYPRAIIKSVSDRGTIDA